MTPNIDRGEGLSAAAATALSRDLRAGGFAGDLLLADEVGYLDACQVWNMMIQRRPGLIARCTSTADVVAAVRCGRERGVLVSVRGGGHNVGGFAVCDGGLAIDLSAMRGVEVDAQARLARAEGGARWADFDAATQKFGLATPGGAISTTGIAGLTLGGGMGWLSRAFGLSCDNLVSVELVTADGEVLTVSDEEHAELFWGLRGGGGNFGIATRLDYRLHAVGPEVLAGFILYPIERAAEALAFTSEYGRRAPTELGLNGGITVAPNYPEVPEELRNRSAAVIAACWPGAIADGERVLEEVRAFGHPALDTIQPMPYVALQAMVDQDFPPGELHYGKSGYVDLTGKAIDTIVSHCSQFPSPKSVCELYTLGGAIVDVAAGATAFSQREGSVLYNILATWTDPAENEVQIEWTRAFAEDLEAHGNGRGYVNFQSDTPVERLRVLYGPETYDRLAVLKATYDPTNFFCHNQNIPPQTEEFTSR